MEGRETAMAATSKSKMRFEWAALTNARPRPAENELSARVPGVKGTYLDPWHYLNTDGRH